MTTYVATTYTYTANGELATKTISGQITSYTYGAMGQLRAVSLPNGTNITYVIDGRNRRVGKQVNGTLTKVWLYKDQLNPVAELDGSGNLVSRFVYGEQSHVPAYMIRGGVTYRFVTDTRGSVRLVVDSSSGTVAQRLDYDAWGKISQDTNPGFQPFAFAGGHYDKDTGLTRFGARDYDAQVGRWTDKDTARFQGGENFYQYSYADPLNFIDDTGNTPLLIPVVAVFALGYYALFRKYKLLAERRNKSLFIRRKAQASMDDKFDVPPEKKCLNRAKHGGFCYLRYMTLRYLYHDYGYLEFFRLCYYFCPSQQRGRWRTLPMHKQCPTIIYGSPM